METLNPTIAQILPIVIPQRDKVATYFRRNFKDPYFMLWIPMYRYLPLNFNSNFKLITLGELKHFDVIINRNNKMFKIIGNNVSDSYLNEIKDLSYEVYRYVE
jgi:hypothetical protein